MSIRHSWTTKLTLHKIFNISKLTFLEKGWRNPKSDFRFLILVNKCSRKKIEWVSLMTHETIMTSQMLYSVGQTLWRHIFLWVISDNHSEFFQEYFFTRIRNLKSDFGFLQPFLRKVSLDILKILWRVNFVVQLCRIDIMCARTN